MLRLIVDHEGVSQKEFSDIYMRAFLGLGAGQRNGFSKGSLGMNIQNDKTYGEFNNVSQIKSILLSWIPQFELVSKSVELYDNKDLLYPLAVEDAVFEEVVEEVIEEPVEEVIELEPFDPSEIVGMTVKDAIAELVFQYLDIESLEIVLNAEKDGKNRITLIREIESVISEKR